MQRLSSPLYPSFLFLFFLFLFLSHFDSTTAADVNRTIDDTLGDITTGFRPIYTPDFGKWEGATCRTCFIKPDVNKAHNGTWTAATYDPGTPTLSLDLQFKGTAIYVYFILARGFPSDTTTRSDCNFTLDGTRESSFTFDGAASTPTTPGPEIIYNVLAFSKTGLTNTNHKLSISTSDVNYSIFLNFDYAEYTFVEETPTSSSTTTSSTSTASNGSSNDATSTPTPVPTGISTGAIAGIVVGAIAILALIGLLIFFLLRRRRNEQYRNRVRVSLISDGPASPGPLATPSMASRQQGSFNPYTAYQSEYTASLYAPGTRPGTQYSNPSAAAWPVSATLPTERADTQYTSEDSQPARQTIFSIGNPDPESSATSSSAPTAAPVSLTAISGAYRGDSKTELRLARQRELEAQMRHIKQEMRDLTNEAAGRRASIRDARLNASREDDDSELIQLRAQIQLMKDQMSLLQTQTQSPWAQGLTDEPPPGYTPSSAGVAPAIVPPLDKS